VQVPISLKRIAPHKALSCLVHYYQLFEFETMDSEIIKPWYATARNYMAFSLGDKPVYFNQKTGFCLSTINRADVLGIATEFNGIMRFAGKYRSFVIGFLPTGISRLFTLSHNELTNRICAADDLFGKEFKELLEQLQTAPSIEEMAKHADTFLLDRCKKDKASHITDCISALSEKLFHGQDLSTVNHYASIVHMSLRNFERTFNELVGISPKFYCKLIRFNKAIAAKAFSPKKEWTGIAYDCGYFDQAHMVKEFHQLSGFSPKELIQIIPPLFFPSCCILALYYSCCLQ
jgi:AraC-like DNA-binding protein